MEKLCSICKKTVDSETAPVLTVGGYGNAKYICEDCAALLDTATTAREFDAVKSAMDSIGEKMAKNNIEDELVIATVGELFIEAKRRAQAIKDGTYDFSLDEAPVAAEQGSDEEEAPIEEFDIPEELRETDEDKELDAADEKKSAFFDKIFNWISLALIVGGVAAIVYLVFFR